jgi:hypothetical protein
MQGTSMSTPAVSGVVALMLQQYRITYFNDANSLKIPLPSIYKAVLCHTAADITQDPIENPGTNFVGPDYIYGYGAVDARRAVDAIRNKRFREGMILSENDEDIFTFNVKDGDGHLRVTLAWDDEAASQGDAPDNILKNDLDLLLIDPTGKTFYYPPWELDPDHPEIPAVRRSYTSEDEAGEHADRVNVVEQVLVDNPIAGTWTVKVKAHELPEPHQRYTIIAGDNDDDRLAGKVDIVMVLDRSGSMNEKASSTSTDKKITVLKEAADLFIRIMKPDIGNQLGLVQFNDDVVDFAADLQPYLQPLRTAPVGDPVTFMRDAVQSIDTGGNTSIGDGLNKARQYYMTYGLPANDRKVVLVTDGKENSESWIDDVKDSLKKHNIEVYPLGFGYGKGIDEQKLIDLAHATGGTYRITADELEFRKFFLEILAGAVNWSVITDPIMELERGRGFTHPVTVTADQDCVTFIAYWRDIADAVKLELIPPSEQAGVIGIDAARHGSRIRTGKSGHYVFYQLDFPLTGKWAGQWAGQWKMKVTRKDNSSVPKVPFSISALASGGAQLDAAFEHPGCRTGEIIRVKATLTRDGKPVTGAKLQAYALIPAKGTGNLLHDANVGIDRLTPGLKVNGDTVGMIDQKLQIIGKLAKQDIFKRLKATIELHDDGRHNDGGANDGIYGGSFDQTTVPGSYNFRFVAEYTPPGVSHPVTREWTKSIYNQVNIDPRHSGINIRLLDLITADNIPFYLYHIDIAPRDKFGNYMGPGYPVALTVVHPNGKTQTHTLNDTIDGAYTGEIRLAQSDVSAGVKLRIDIGGKPFATIDKLPAGKPTDKTWGISLHAGRTYPLGSFDKNYDSGLMLGLDIDYRLTPQLSMVGFLGYNRFSATFPAWNDTHWWNISANFKYQFSTNPIHPYINGGPGLYIPQNGTVQPGLNFGLGVDYNLNYNWTLELGGDYHHIFTGGSGTRFLVSRAGLIFTF